MPPKHRSVKKTARQAARKASKKKSKSPPKSVVKCPQAAKEVTWKRSKNGDRWVKQKPTKVKVTSKGPEWKGVGVGASKEWAKGEGEYKTLSKAGNVKLGAYGWEAKSGYSYNTKEKSHQLDVFKAKAEGSVLSAEVEKQVGVFQGKAAGKVLAAEAEASLGGEWGQKAKEIHAKAGASADLVKGEVSGGLKIPLFGGRSVTLGGTLEGQVGASAEASAHAGWTQKKGYQAGFKLKAGLGLGAGLSFNIGFQ